MVMNYCPLAFCERAAPIGRRTTVAKERTALFAACDEHLQESFASGTRMLIGVGDFAGKRAREVIADSGPTSADLHPSPACPAST